MDSKERLVSRIVDAESWKEYHSCLTECMNIFKIIHEVNTSDGINEFLSSYGDTIQNFGSEILFRPVEVRDELVELINDEIKKDYDIYVTYKLITAIVLLGGIVKINESSATFMFVADLFNCIDIAKRIDESLFTSFQRAKGTKL